MLLFSSVTLGRSPAPKPRSHCSLISYMGHGGWWGTVQKKCSPPRSCLALMSQNPVALRTAREDVGNSVGSKSVLQVRAELTSLARSRLPKSHAQMQDFYRNERAVFPRTVRLRKASSIYPSPKSFLSVATALRWAGPCPAGVAASWWPVPSVTVTRQNGPGTLRPGAGEHGGTQGCT